MPHDVTDKVEAFFAHYRLRNYTKGQILILNNDRPENIFYLVEGRVKKYDITKSGDELIINVYQPYSFFPMSLAMTHLENKYIYEAETDIVIKQAPTEEVLAFVKSNPDILYDLLQRVYVGIEGVLGRMVHLMSSSAHQRVLYELVVEAKRFGEPRSDGHCQLNLSEKDLGARAGLSRETVSREVHKLKKQKLILVQNKQIIILNLTALEGRLNQEV